MTNISDSIKSSGELRLTDQFKFVASRSIDNKYRLNLGQKIIKLLNEWYPFKSFDIYISSNGYILLQPMNVIPANEQWIWINPQVKASFERALEDAREERTIRVEDLDNFLETL